MRSYKTLPDFIKASSFLFEYLDGYIEECEKTDADYAKAVAEADEYREILEAKTKRFGLPFALYDEACFYKNSLERNLVYTQGYKDCIYILKHLKLL